jgi:hypothetical protein
MTIKVEKPKIIIKVEKPKVEKPKVEKPKVEFIECNIKNWYLNHKEKELYVVHGSEVETHHGVFLGLEKLSNEEKDIFLLYTECFYYHGKMCENNLECENDVECENNLENDDCESCECQMGAEFSSVIVESLTNIYDLDIFMKVIKPILIEDGIEVEE